MNEIPLEKIKEDIEAAEKPSGFPVKLIAIDGHGGAGKSTLAQKLAGLLNAQIINLDDFDSVLERGQYRPKLEEEILKPIQQGIKKLSYKRTSWWPDHHPEPVKDQPVTPIMILEGASSARKEFRPYLTYAIWVETPMEICMKRGLERDGQKARKRWEEWFAKEEKYIKRDNPQDYADIIVSGND